MCGPPPGVELRLRVTLVHCTLQSVLCLTHADSDSVVLVPSPPLPSPPLLPLLSPLLSYCLEVLMELFVCGPSFNSAALRHSVSMMRESGQLPLMTASPLSTPVGVTSRFV